MQIERLVRERRAGWSRLERLLDEAEAAPDRELGHDRLSELLALYRQTCTDLNEARSCTANREVLERLNYLAGRGYRFIYRGARQRMLWPALARFLRYDVPDCFHRRLGHVAVAAAALGLGFALGFLAVFAEPDNGRRLIPAEFFTESPSQRVERIEEGKERIETVDQALYFGVSLYTHNIQVSFLAFGLAAVSIVGGLWLLFYNGAILGAVAATYAVDGVAAFFLAWVGPHGVLEIPAIVFGGAAGLVLGGALLLPGHRTTASAVREAFPDVWRMMVTTALVLVAAGLIEGSFSQLSSKSAPTPLKITLAGALLASLLVYLFLPRGGSSENQP